MDRKGVQEKIRINVKTTTTEAKMEVIIGLLISFGLYLLYGLGVIHGQRFERKKQARQARCLEDICRDTKPKTTTYQFSKSDGYELFQINNN